MSVNFATSIDYGKREDFGSDIEYNMHVAEVKSNRQAYHISQLHREVTDVSDIYHLYCIWFEDENITPTELTVIDAFIVRFPEYKKDILEIQRSYLDFQSATMITNGEKISILKHEFANALDWMRKIQGAFRQSITSGTTGEDRSVNDYAAEYGFANDLRYLFSGSVDDPEFHVAWYLIWFISSDEFENYIKQFNNEESKECLRKCMRQVLLQALAN